MSKILNYKSIFIFIIFSFSTLILANVELDDEVLYSLFNPFKMSTHKILMSKYGPETTNEIYQLYIKSKKFGDDCKNLIGSCDYYLCRENLKSCGVKGYFVGFAYQYCGGSLHKLMNEVSPYGRKWLLATVQCLQSEMEKISNDLTCNQIKKMAITTHSECYNKLSFCQMPFSDILKIGNLIKPALLEEGVIFEGVEVLLQCTRR